MRNSPARSPVQPQPKSGLRHRLLANAGTIQPSALDGPALNGSDRAGDLYEASLQAVRSGNTRLALDLIGRACSAPRVPAKFYQLHADLLWRNGNSDAAVRTARMMVQRYSKDACAWDFLSRLLIEQKTFPEARSCCEKAIALDPGLLESRHNLATILQRQGDTEEAEAQYRAVLEKAPDHIETHLNLACLLNDSGRYTEALQSVEKAIARDPGLARAYVIASAIEYRAGRYPSALAWIELAIERAPDQITFLTRRADALSKLGNSDLALADCEKVLAQLANDVDAIRAKASILQDLDRPEEALNALFRAQAENPDEENFPADRAWLLAEMGRKDEALQLLDDVLSTRPNCALALDCRAFLSRHRLDHPDMVRMQDIVSNSASAIKDRTRLCFAIGRAQLGAGDGEKAFHYLNLGNRLKRKTVTYDRATEEQWFSCVMRVFSDHHLPLLAGGDVKSRRPIFVFGMPRSGTTLVEQILASHPGVRGTGESPYLDTLARSDVFSPGVPGFTTETLASCAERYLKLVGAGVPDTLRLVDKTNSNFLYAGLISVMLPGARMIHCRRNPLDTCLSSYSLLFARGNEFSYDLAELGHYYGLYRKMMAHWNSVLPAGTLLNIEYEALVDDTEAQSRKILDFCELPWDDSCLRFYETKRLVTTSSLDQVRSPIYRSSVGRAEIFRPWLGSLIQALDEVPNI